MSTLVFHNIVAPYRNKLFEELAKNVEVDVYFSKSNNENRNWDASPSNYNYQSRILYHFEIGPFVVNPLLLYHLYSDNPDTIIAAETLQTVLSTFLLLLFSKLTGKSFILWSGVFSDENKNKRLPAQIHDISNRFLRKSILTMYILFSRIYRRVLYRYADSYIAYSEKSKEYLIETGVPESEIYTGGQIMPEEQLPDQTKSNIATDELEVLYLGYLRDIKGIDVLIESFKLIKRDDVRLNIAGDGPERSSLEELAAGDDRISFEGYVTGDNKTNAYRRADIFVLPTFHDPWGLVVNEAMEYGLPIITTESAGCSYELIDKNGLIVPTGNPHSLSIAIECLARKDSLRAEMGDDSKRMIREFNTVENGIEPFLLSIQSVSD